MEKSKNKVMVGIAIIVFLIGVIIVAVKGFHIDLHYQDCKNIEMNLGQTFESKDIKNIAKEVLGTDDIIVQKVEIYEDAVSITAKDISEEQRNNIVEKINEKYGKEIKAEETTINTVPRMHLRDLANQYKSPFIIATICILVYMMIRYYRLKSLKVFIKTVAVVVIAQLELFAIIAITRIPIGRLTIPMVLTVYMLSLIGCTTYFEKQLEIKKQEK